MMFQFNMSAPDDYVQVLKTLQSEYPEYLQEPQRLEKIFSTINAKEVTMLVEEEYIDKQYRDSYYSYFSQKYSTYKRNCMRLSLFDGTISWEEFSDFSSNLNDIIIGTIVLRPLRIGNIGNVLLSPSKLKVKGYFRKCTFKVMVYGRKIHFEAFPFSSQDNETMTCAENALFNLIRYYGRKYPEYREIMPSEILQNIERESYERVLPSMGVDDTNIAKVLSDSFFYPRIYGYQPDFNEILYIYIESGIPLLLGIPEHVVTCIGHGFQPFRKNKSWLEGLAAPYTFNKNEFWYLATSDIYQEYIVMDDNKSPYHLITINDLVKEYYDSPLKKDTSIPTKDSEYDIEQVKSDMVSLIVPLYKRIFIDAARAMNIFKSVFLGNPEFIDMVREEYSDQTWGNTSNNPFVWRIFLTTSKSYKSYKSKTVKNPFLRTHYMEWSMPHFVWVLEIGTLDTYINDCARIEILLDATSSPQSQNYGILSIGYKNHYVYIKDRVFTIKEKNALDTVIEAHTSASKPSTCSSSSKTSNDFLTNLLKSVYNTKCVSFEDSYAIFADSNLKGNLDNGSTAY